MNNKMPLTPSQHFVISGTKGSTTPRRYTPPLIKGEPGPCGCGCALTPETSYGFAVVEFAEKVLGQPLTPWQRWVVIHLGELLTDGRPRFRRVLILVARQNGKTHLLKVLTAFWMLVQQVENILGLSTNRESAKLPWEQTLRMIQNSPLLAPLIDQVKKGNNDTFFSTKDGSTYRIRAANDGAARGLTIDRVVIDEARQQKTFDAWDAVMPTMAARPYAQAIVISNAGDDRSVVLNRLQAEATELIDAKAYESGTDTFRVALFEWSADPVDDITKPETWAKANPNMGFIFSEDELRGDAFSAESQGGEVLAGFKTERLCMRVSSMDAAVDPEKWAACYDDSASMADADKHTIQYGLDVSITRTHATLVALGSVDGVPFVRLVREWRDSAVRNLMADVKKEIIKNGIKNLSIMPAGPIGGYKPDLLALRIPGLRVHVIAEQKDACMHLADEVIGKRITHRSIDKPDEQNDEVLTRQVLAAEKKYEGDRWRVTRQNVGNVDAYYAIAAALYQYKSASERPQITFMSIEPEEGAN